jgi:hypothetical protein
MHPVNDELGVLVAKDKSGRLVFAGTAWREAIIHRYGVPHTTVLLVVIVEGPGGEPLLVVHRRPPDKSVAPGLRDLNGGHVVFSMAYFAGRPFESQYDLEKAILDTSLIELAQEIQTTPAHEFRAGDLYQFREAGAFECDTATATGRNVELSTCMMALAPRGELRVFETAADGSGCELASECLPLPALLTQFREHRNDFADGATRILAALCADAGLKDTFCDLAGKMIGTARVQRSI